MAVLAGIFGGSQEQSQDSDKLLHLYWNRAELKKEFASLRNEQYRLRDQVKQQQGETARVQQQLEQLENLLIDPEWARNVLVYYQLRGFADRCERKITRFAEQLKQQREQKQHNRVLVAWNDERTRESRVIELEILETRNTVMELEDRLQHEQSRLMAMSGFLKIFRRRAVNAQLDKLRDEIALREQQELELKDALEQIRNRRPPENQGLDIPTKRSINYMILAYAQQLYLHYFEDNLVNLAKEAGDKSVGAVNYGGKADCDDILEKLAKRREEVGPIDITTNTLQQRAKLIAEKAGFRRDNDVVPVPATVATVFDISRNGVIYKIDANLLGENYFGLAKVLSR